MELVERRRLIKQRETDSVCARTCGEEFEAAIGTDVLHFYLKGYSQYNEKT